MAYKVLGLPTARHIKQPYTSGDTAYKNKGAEEWILKS
nr:MAG TPA: hypothetical protein [Caudoviricetes sp.]DAO60532.1 MAG TPA: hypothetical protein [Caudoviricetes sp.]DAP84016.1 MAG TPA: hypothetical protein [Caudoviricetes sp.]